MCPDITMCKDEDCPYKDKCYRFVAKQVFISLILLIVQGENTSVNI